MARRSGLRAALRRAPVLAVGEFAKFDLGRGRRSGAPEIILAEGKRPEEVVALLERLFRRRRGALVSRMGAAHRAAIGRAAHLPVELLAGGRIARLRGPLGARPDPGPVALLTAGTADGAVAEEVRAVLGSLGVRVVAAYDVGVAGLHRLLRALERIRPLQPRAYLVCAGREGTLPGVVAGLVRAPVIGIPTSSGYGRGGRGEGALTAMLQSCAPIAVVNIDGGVPAALFTAQLLAAPRARRRAPSRGARSVPGRPVRRAPQSF
jgi:pyridinium-3,5-biscarboxylic acid mononucleotide synthase